MSITVKLEVASIQPASSRTMKLSKLTTLVGLVILFSTIAFGQSPTYIKRTTHKQDRLDFGVGGSLSVIGAPNGSIRIEGWSNREVEITAEIEIQAANAQDLDRISKVTGFVLEESLGRIGVISAGTHDKKYLKKADKKFPKTLLGLPFKVDYLIKVPRYCDLEIDGGAGDLTVSGVEGTMKINFLETAAKIDLIGGGITATIGTGSLDLTIPSRSWRGHFADVQVANGTMNVWLPTGLNADFDANILRTGSIENGFTGFVPKTRKTEFTEKSIAAKSGAGTIPVKFTVGDGTLKITEIGKPS